MSFRIWGRGQLGVDQKNLAKVLLRFDVVCCSRRSVFDVVMSREERSSKPS